jgi:hypothetical protein
MYNATSSLRGSIYRTNEGSTFSICELVEFLCVGVIV